MTPIKIPLFVAAGHLSCNCPTSKKKKKQNNKYVNKASYELENFDLLSKKHEIFFFFFRLWIKGCISLSALLGITWLLGIAYVHFNQLFAYSFVILNGLQGFFIFLFRCVCNVQYKTALLQKLKSCFPDSDELINYKASFVFHQKTSLILNNNF